MNESPDRSPPEWFTPEELADWQRRLAEANRHNVFCHCRDCDAEWVGSAPLPCPTCGSDSIEHILCWQFPDG